MMSSKSVDPVEASDINPQKDGKEGSITPVQDWEPSEEKSLVRRIDWHVMPMLCLVFGFSLLDRNNISAAYIAGMSTDLKISVGARYSIALLVFFPGYAIFEIPSNLVIRRVGARVWLSILITSWGLIVLGMGFVQKWEALAGLRALLGIFEAGLFPGAVFIIGAFYKTYETAERISIFYMAALLASGFGGIIAYALSLIQVGDGIYKQGWRWIYIIEGTATVAAGLLAFWLLGDFPEKSGFLNDRQKYIALTRLKLDRGAGEYKHVSVKKSLSFLLDWKLLGFCVQYYFAASSVYSLAYFLPIILKDGLGFDYKLSLILTSPPYIFTIIASILMARLSDKYRTRWPFLCAQSLIATAGLLIVLYGGLPGVRLFGTFLAVWGTQANVPGSLAYGQNQTVRPEMRGIVAAAMISVGAAGGVTGSTIFKSSDAPVYLPGMWATIAMQITYTLVTFGMSMYFKRQNRLLDEKKIKPIGGIEEFRYAP